MLSTACCHCTSNGSLVKIRLVSFFLLMDKKQQLRALTAALFHLDGACQPARTTPTRAGSDAPRLNAAVAIDDTCRQDNNAATGQRVTPLMVVQSAGGSIPGLDVEKNATYDMKPIVSCFGQKAK